MTRIILIIVFVMISLQGYSQVPFVSWEPVRTEPIRLPETTNPFPPRSSRIYSEPSKPKINEVNTELIDADSYDFYSEKMIKTKVKIISYSNGEKRLFLVGKKIYDSWISTNNFELFSITYLLAQSKDESVKSVLLELSEAFTHIAIDDHDRYFGF